MKRKIKTLALAALIAALSGGAWYVCNRGVTNEDLREDIHGAENRLEVYIRSTVLEVRKAFPPVFSYNWGRTEAP